MRFAKAALLALPLILNGCAPRPMDVSELRHYTGLKLCDGARVHDLSTRQERDTTPGFSFHVTLAMPQMCRSSFEGQVRRLAGGNCASLSDRFACFVMDASASGTTHIHTSLAVQQTAGSEYDLRFYE